VTSPKKGGRRREPGLFRPHSHSPSESPGQRDMSPWREVRRPPCSRGGGSASGSLGRFELSAQARRRSEYLTLAASTTCERSAMLAHPSTDGRSWSRKHRVSCGERMRDLCAIRQLGPRVRVSASSVALRSTRRASATRQTGGAAQGGLERRRHAGFLREFSSLLTVKTLTGMATDVYPRENCIVPAIVFIVWTTNTKK